MKLYLVQHRESKPEQDYPRRPLSDEGGRRLLWAPWSEMA